MNKIIEMNRITEQSFEQTWRIIMCVDEKDLSGYTYLKDLKTAKEEDLIKKTALEEYQEFYLKQYQNPTTGDFSAEGVEQYVSLSEAAIKELEEQK